MSTKHRWLALVVALSLLAGALAPATALAARGGRPIDNPGEPIDPPLEYGDPDPDPVGSPSQSGYEAFDLLRRVVFDVARVRFGLPVAGSVGFARTSKAMRARFEVRPKL